MKSICLSVREMWNLISLLTSRVIAVAVLWSGWDLEGAARWGWRQCRAGGRVRSSARIQPTNPTADRGLISPAIHGAQRWLVSVTFLWRHQQVKIVICSLCSPEDASYWFWWFHLFPSNTTTTLKFMFGWNILPNVGQAALNLLYACS